MRLSPERFDVGPIVIARRRGSVSIDLAELELTRIWRRRPGDAAAVVDVLVRLLGSDRIERAARQAIEPRRCPCCGAAK